MRYILIGSLLGLMLLSIYTALDSDGFDDSTSPGNSSPDLNGAAEHLVSALWRLFGLYAEFDMSVQKALWNLTPPDLRPLLGMLKVAHLLITIWGLISLSIIRRLIKRVI